MSKVAFNPRDTIISIGTPPQSAAPTTAHSERTDGTAATPTTDDGQSDTGGSGTKSEAPAGGQGDQSAESEPDSSDSEEGGISEGDEQNLTDGGSKSGSGSIASSEQGSDSEEENDDDTEFDSDDSSSTASEAPTSAVPDTAADTAVDTPGLKSGHPSGRSVGTSKRRDDASTTPPGSPPASALPTGRTDGEGESEDTSADSEEEPGSPSTGDQSGAVLESTAPELPPEVPRRRRTPRTLQHEMARLASLYVFPVLLAIPLSLILSLNAVLLTPLYNSLPLTLHTPSLYVVYTIPPAIVYWYATLHSSAKDAVSARVCFSLVALSGDMVAVYGRRMGSLTGQMAGPEWGAVAAKAGLGIGAVTGSTTFALLCFDHISPVAPAKDHSDRMRNLINIIIRSAAFTAHVYVGERMWRSLFLGGLPMLTQSPEKSILFVSLLLTALLPFVRPSASKDTFPTKLGSFFAARFNLSPKARAFLTPTVSFLPRQALPVILLLRLPLLIVALRQQIYLRPPGAGVEPYVTAHGELRMLSSEQSLTGQIVVGDNLKDGYRFLRCDHSILGGRWIREKPGNGADGKREVEMGDSIFATFNLQEVVVLAHRNDPAESPVKTLALTTDLEVMLEGEEDTEDKAPDRALIIGLGAGIAAQGFAKRGLRVDVVEIDPSVYTAAATYFDLPPPLSANIMDGSSFISQLAVLARTNTTDPSVDAASLQALERLPKWSYIVQDCFTGGSVPGEMFTKEFWEDIGEVLVDDGIVAMNFAGLLRSKASKAVLVTLLSVFPQCRAFGDGFEANNGPNDLTNMVVFCTKTHSPLLTFRRPTSMDVLRSPLRSHVYSTFHPHEIQLDSIVEDADHGDPQMMLRRGDTERLAKWQQGTAMATWRAMQKILTPEMWLAY